MPLSLSARPWVVAVGVVFGSAKPFPGIVGSIKDGVERLTGVGEPGR
jgi:hypothetical protein